MIRAMSATASPGLSLLRRTLFASALPLLSVGAAALALAPSAASAQETSGDIEVQLFEPAVGPQTFLTVSGADVMAHKQYQASAVLSYMTNPFTVWNVNETTMDIEGERSKVVESLLPSWLSDPAKVALALAVPALMLLVCVTSTDSLRPPTPVAVAVQGVCALPV